MKNSIDMKQFYPSCPYPYLYQVGGGVFAQSLVPLESSFLPAMEAFDPNLQNDPFRWMPFGIMHDLRDDTNTEEIFPPTDDQVSGFTLQEMFNALQSDVINPIQFRDRLLLQNSNNQQTEVNTLFRRYGY